MLKRILPAVAALSCLTCIAYAVNMHGWVSSMYS